MLASYGLEAVITGEDDADLRAAVLLRHWPSADDPALDAGGSLSFGIHGPPEAFWGFERAASGGGRTLRVTSVEGDPASGDLPDLAPVSVRYPYFSPEMERPSAGKDRVVVEAGAQHGPLAGRGAAKVWRRTPGAGGPLAWEETEEVVSVWRS